MRARGRSPLVAVVAVLVALLAGACADGEAAARHRIAVVRSLPASPREVGLYEGLGEGGYSVDEVEVIGRDADDVAPDAEAVRTAVTAAVDAGAEVVIALSTTAAAAAREVADAVPILALVNDPVASGLVRDTRRPEGTVTGVAYRVPADRVLGIGIEAFGELDEVGCLYGDGDPANEPALDALVRGAAALDIVLRCDSWTEDSGVASAVASLVAGGVDALVVLNSPATVRSFPALERALASVSVPILTSTPADFSTVSLQPDGMAVYRQLGRQAARLLDGVPVAEIPVEDPAAYELVVNLAVARRMGLELPQSVVERASKVVGR